MFVNTLTGLDIYKCCYHDDEKPFNCIQCMVQQLKFMLLLRLFCFIIYWMKYSRYMLHPLYHAIKPKKKLCLLFLVRLTVICAVTVKLFFFFQKRGFFPLQKFSIKFWKLWECPLFKIREYTCKDLWEF